MPNMIIYKIYLPARHRELLAIINIRKYYAIIVLQDRKKSRTGTIANSV